MSNKNITDRDIETAIPPFSRSKLEWHVFEETDQGDWAVNLLPPFYAGIFEDKLGHLMQKSNTGWRDSKSGKSRYAFFEGLTEAEIEDVGKFIEDYKQLVIIGLSKHIKDVFSGELDSCIALDYNFIKPKLEERTAVGGLEHRAKYSRDESAIDELASLMSLYLDRIPFLNIDDKTFFSYIPGGPVKMDFHLPKIIAEKLALHVKDKYFKQYERPVIDSSLSIKKPEFKDIILKDRLLIWKNLFADGYISFSTDVRDKTIILVDDLYQSGATMWSFAQCLKQLGARKVHGFVCVKAMRDKG